jgi:hypothetical protein
MRKKNMKRFMYLAVFIAFIFAGCRFEGGRSSDGAPLPVTIFTLQKVSGDQQTGTMGIELAEPLVVSVMSESGEPAANVEVEFTIKSGRGDLSSSLELTDAAGNASVYLTPGGSLKDVEVEVSSEGFESVIFIATPLLPLLSDIANGTVDGDSVADMKVMFAETDTGLEVLVVFLGEDAGVKLDFPPTVADILGGVIRGAAVEDIPTLFVPGKALVDKIYTDVTPTASTIAANFTSDGSPGAGFPVVTYLDINGKASVVGLMGDTTGIPGVGILGTMLDNGDTVDVDGWPVLIGNLPFYAVQAADFPADPAADSYSYKLSAFCSVIPMYNALEPVGGAAPAANIPFYTDSLPLARTKPVDIEGGVTKADVAIRKAPAASDVGAPLTTLRPLDLDWIPVVEAMEQIKAVSAGNDQVMAGMVNDLMGILGWALTDIDALMGLLEGGNIDVYAIVYPLIEVMPSMNGMSQDMQIILPDLEQQLIIVETDLIPAIAAALEDEGGYDFGGYAGDMTPSNVTNDVLPMLQEIVYILQDMVPVLERFFINGDDLIPDDGDMLQLVINATDGGLEKVITDVNELIPMLGDLLAVIENPGMTIITDLNEELVFRYNGTSATLADLGIFQEVVGFLEAYIPPDLMLSDIEIFTALIDVIGPILGGVIDPALLEGMSFLDLVPLLGSLDLGGTLPGLITMVVDLLGPMLLGIVDALQNFPGIPPDIF